MCAADSGGPRGNPDPTWSPPRVCGPFLSGQYASVAYHGTLGTNFCDLSFEPRATTRFAKRMGVLRGTRSRFAMRKRARVGFSVPLLFHISQVTPRRSVCGPGGKWCVVWDNVSILPLFAAACTARNWLIFLGNFPSVDSRSVGLSVASVLSGSSCGPRTRPEAGMRGAVLRWLTHALPATLLFMRCSRLWPHPSGSPPVTTPPGESSRRSRALPARYRLSSESR